MRPPPKYGNEENMRKTWLDRLIDVLVHKQTRSRFWEVEAKKKKREREGGWLEGMLGSAGVETFFFSLSSTPHCAAGGGRKCTKWPKSNKQSPIIFSINWRRLKGGGLFDWFVERYGRIFTSSCETLLPSLSVFKKKKKLKGRERGGKKKSIAAKPASSPRQHLRRGFVDFWKRSKGIQRFSSWRLKFAHSPSKQKSAKQHSGQWRKKSCQTPLLMALFSGA